MSRSDRYAIMALLWAIYSRQLDGSPVTALIAGAAAIFYFFAAAVHGYRELRGPRDP